MLGTGQNTCKIQSVGSGKVLDVEGASVQDGARVLQWDDHSAANQHWSLVPVPSQPAATSQPVTAGQPSATSQPVAAGQPSTTSQPVAAGQPNATSQPDA